MTDKQKNENKRIAENLCFYIKKKYKSEAEFCREYIKRRSAQEESFVVSDNTEKNMYEALRRMKRGEECIQIKQLPYFTELLGVTCEDILSLDKPIEADRERITSYNTACSSDEKVWEEYFNHKECLGAYCDEYGMTVVDYAIKLRNYGLIKFIAERKENSPYKDIMECFQSTAVERDMIRSATEYWNYSGRDFERNDGNRKRKEIIYMAIKNNDVDMLENLKAKNEFLFEVTMDYCGEDKPVKDHFYDKKMLELISETRSNKVIDYYSQGSESKYKHVYIFPYVSEIVDMLLSKGKTEMALIALRNICAYNRRIVQEIESVLDKYLDNVKDQCANHLIFEYMRNLPKGTRAGYYYPDEDLLKESMKNDLKDKNIEIKPIGNSSLVYEIMLNFGGHFRFVPVKIDVSSDDPIIKEIIDDINCDYAWMFNYQNNIGFVIDRYFENNKGDEDA